MSTTTVRGHWRKNPKTGKPVWVQEHQRKTPNSYSRYYMLGASSYRHAANIIRIIANHWDRFDVRKIGVDIRLRRGSRDRYYVYFDILAPHCSYPLLGNLDYRCSNELIHHLDNFSISSSAKSADADYRYFTHPSDLLKFADRLDNINYYTPVHEV